MPCIGFLAFLLLVSYAFAGNDRVESISEEGIIVLNNGLHIQLAGLVLAPESAPILHALLRNKIVQIKYENSLRQAASHSPQPAYVFVETKEAAIPLRRGAAVRKKRVMVNELLISLGAAKVAGGINFKKRKDFLKLEAKARAEGEGIWSYESHVPLLSTRDQKERMRT